MALYFLIIFVDSLLFLLSWNTVPQSLTIVPMLQVNKYQTLLDNLLVKDDGLNLVPELYYVPLDKVRLVVSTKFVINTLITKAALTTFKHSWTSHIR